MSREETSVGRLPDGERELDAINQLLEEEPELSPAAEALVASLDEAALPAGGWEALRAKLDASPGHREVGRRPAEQSDPASVPAAEPDDPWQTDFRAAPPAQVGRAQVATRWVVGLVLVAAVVVAGSWGVLKAGEAAKLRDDQRILAYWMANPNMQLVAVGEPGAAVEAGNARLGVVCVLPDGRALLLQPSGAPRGATYVVRERGPGGSQELARGRGNLIQFDASGVAAVEIVLARGDDTEVVGMAAFN